MSCSTTQELFSEFYDGGLTTQERRGLEEHLGACGGCRTEFQHYSTSLKALGGSGMLETTQVFLANVRAAAAEHLERREPVPRAEGRWVPAALAAVALLAAGFGWLLRGGGAGEELARLRRDLEELKGREPQVITVTPPVDAAQVLRDQGLIQVEGQWLPRALKEAFDEGKVALGGRIVERAQAAEFLAKEFPPPPPPPLPVPVASAEEAILERHGLVRVEGLIVPKASLERWREGQVQVGVNQWKKAADFRAEFMRENDLVDLRGRLVTREQAEAAKAQAFVRRPDAAATANEVTRRLEGLQVGVPMNFRGLTIYPLIDPAGAAERAGALPFHAALAGGKVEVSDKGEGVFSVQVKNGLENDLLLLAGEVLMGGRCARVVAEDTLVPRKKTGTVPVLCVEPGAWRAAADFKRESGHYVAPPSFRRALAAELGQGAVWALLTRRGKAPSAPDLFRRHSDAVLEYRGHFSEMPEREPAAVGIAVAIGEGVDHAELFPNRALLRACFDRLVAGAAVDLLDRPADAPRTPPAFVNSAAGVKQFLEEAFLLAYEKREEGWAMKREEACAGRACAAGGALQHASLFAGGPPEWERKSVLTVPPEKIRRALAEIEARFKGAGASRKIGALQEMASLPSPEVLPALVRHIGDGEKAAAREAVRQLGLRGDARAVESLAPLLAKSRKDAPLYAEIARALARLGAEAALEPLLREVDSGEAEPARIVILALPELLLQVRTRETLERATARLVSVFEAAESAAKGAGAIDPMARNLRPAEAQALAEACRTAFHQLTGQDAASGTDARLWWNARDNRDRFLKERTGR